MAPEAPLDPLLVFQLLTIILGRQSLYPAEDGLFEKYLAVGKEHKILMQEAYKKFSIEKLHVPRDMETRGVLDAEKLPNYYYRCITLIRPALARLGRL